MRAWHIKSSNICKTCQNGKDRYKESCFCTQYGIIVTYGKEKCKGYKSYPKKEGQECNSLQSSEI